MTPQKRARGGKSNRIPKATRPVAGTSHKPVARIPRGSRPRIRRVFTIEHRRDQVPNRAWKKKRCPTSEAQSGSNGSKKQQKVKQFPFPRKFKLVHKELKALLVATRQTYGVRPPQPH
jgi:hypothetical protein